MCIHTFYILWMSDCHCVHVIYNEPWTNWVNEHLQERAGWEHTFVCRVHFHPCPSQQKLPIIAHLMNSEVGVFLYRHGNEIQKLCWLVTSPAADHIQVGTSHAQSSEHVHSALPAQPFICHPTAGTIVHENRLLLACFPVFLAPSLWNSLPQTVLISVSLSVFKSRLKTILFNQAFTEH